MAQVDLLAPFTKAVWNPRRRTELSVGDTMRLPEKDRTTLGLLYAQRGIGFLKAALKLDEQVILRAASGESITDDDHKTIADWIRDHIE